MKQIINNEVELEVPEGFKVLNDEEIKNWLGKFSKDSFAMRNVDKHVAIVVSYKKTNFLNRNMPLDKVLASGKSTLKTVKPTIKFLEEINTTIDGKQALGVIYSESIKGIDQKVDYLLVKHNDYHYSFNYLGRIETYDECHGAYEKVLKSIRFKD